MRIAVGQVAFSPFKYIENKSIIINSLKIAKNSEAKLLILPELSITAYSMESVNKISKNRLDSFHNEISCNVVSLNVELIIGSLEITESDRYNVLIHFSVNGDITVLYRKAHLFIGEARVFSKGNSLPYINKILDINSSFAICYDLRFPELFINSRKNGAKIIYISAAWPKARIDHWKLLLKARAIENQFFIIASNRIGCDENLIFGGYSMVINPNGDVLNTIEDNNGVFITDIDLGDIKKIRQSLPFGNDRRTDLY